MTRRYRIYNFIRFLGDSFFFPYFSLYIASLGYEGTTLGIILSITPFVNIIANTIWSTLQVTCKNKKDYSMDNC
jgi:hypothetical protein